MKNNKKDYLIILIFGFVLTSILVGFNIYGSSVDWINQHTAIPDVFRKLFYETHKLIPNLIFNLGAGQNIFNYSYYGLVNPIILISYLFPFINMTVYISITSFILYILTGILTFKFLNYKNISEKVSLFIALVILSISPLTYHFHHHIMFVSYYPFLILSLIGVDKYLKDNKSWLLMVSIILLILTNYYFSVPSLIVIAIYGIYSLLNKKDYKIKEFLREVLKSSVRVVIPIVVCSFILLPTMYSIINTGRPNASFINIKDLLAFNINETMYQGFSMGISFIFLLSLFGNILSKEKKKGDIFLNIVLIIIIFIPIFTYFLNGFLYVRGKVLIPFAILYFISLIDFIKNLKDNNINFKWLLICTIILIIFAIITNFKSNYLIYFIGDAIITSICIYLYKRHQKIEIIFIPLIIILSISSYFYNKNEEYISYNDYNEKYLNKEKDIYSLLNRITEDGYYRTQNIDDYRVVANKYYNSNYYTTSIYSSNYNYNFWNFFNFEAGNNIQNRNAFVSSGTNSPLFYTLMGVKYIISPSEIGLNYKKIASTNNDLSLYYNPYAYPIIYTANYVGNKEKYDSLTFPYNLEYLMKYPITNNQQNSIYESNIEELDLNLEKEYHLELKKGKTYNINLEQAINNKYILIRFKMNYNETCDNGDTSITINGVKNKLTCKTWFYHNNNTTFEYVISSNDPIWFLKIHFTKGKFDISDIHIYTMDNILPKYKSADEIKIDKKNSAITANVNIKDDSYVITSLPFDKGYKVYVDDEEKELEIVNINFLGFKVNSGQHKIKIVYSSPFYKEGVIISLVGLTIMVIVIAIENKQKIRSKKNGKNKYYSTML